MNDSHENFEHESLTTSEDDMPRQGHGFLETADRIRLVAVTILAVCALLGTVVGAWASLNRFAKANTLADVQALRDADATMSHRQDATDARVDRLVNIMELQVTLTMEPKGSAEYAEAAARLRAMRRVVQ